MSDLISRQDAIDAIRASASKFTGFMEMEMYTDDDAVEAINGVPSAEPVRHGKWILERRFTIDSMHSYIQYQCTCCGRYYVTKTNYCPNCGARIVEPQESEVHDADND